MPETRYPPMVSAPTPLQQQIPGFPVVPGSADEDLSAYDLDAAVANNVPGADPQRSMFNVVGSEPRRDRSRPAARRRHRCERRPPASRLGTRRADDPVRRQHLAAGRRPPRPSRVHAAARRTTATGRRSNHTTCWRAPAPSRWTSCSTPSSPARSRPPRSTHATVTPSDGLMRIMGGGFARRFDVEVPIEYLRPYGALLFANVSDGAVDSDAAPDAITFQVYVTAEAHLALVTSNFTVGPQNFVLSQFFDRRPANVRIELPTVRAGLDATGDVCRPGRHRALTTAIHRPSPRGAVRSAPGFDKMSTNDRPDRRHAGRRRAADRLLRAQRDACVGVPQAPPSARRAARGARRHLAQGRLLAVGPVRLLHGADRRQGRGLVPAIARRRSTAARSSRSRESTRPSATRSPTPSRPAVGCSAASASPAS